jgi:phage terminase large subunit
MKINAPKKLIPAFDNLKQTCLYDIIIMEGGRGGAKSEALSALGVLESFIDDGVILCCREIQKSIADSLYATIVSTIYKYELQSYFKIIQGEITNNLTGARFIFAGLKSNITSIKSINKLRVVLVDEAENVTPTIHGRIYALPHVMAMCGFMLCLIRVLSKTQLGNNLLLIKTIAHYISQSTGMTIRGFLSL